MPAHRRLFLAAARFGPAFRIAALTAGAALLAGCATLSSERVLEDIRTGTGVGSYVEGAPFVRQVQGQCGPAALAMLAQFWGVDVDPAEIAGEIYLPSVRGTLNVDLAEYAERFGFWVRSYRGSIEDLKRKVDAGVPVIVLARLPGLFRRPNHYFMVIGYEDRRRVFVVHSGTRADQVLPQPMLDGWWAANRRWALIVCPPDRVAWELTAGEANDLGVWLERAGRFDEALGRYAESLRTDPDQAYVHVNRGNALAALGRFAEAEDAYRQALLLDPDNVAGLNNLACAVAERDGDLEEALDLARRAVEIDLLERPNSLDTLAFVLMRAGHLEEARRCVEQGLVLARERGRDDWVAVLEGRLDEIRAAETRGDVP